MAWTARYWDFYDQYVVCVRRHPEYAVNRYYAHLVDPLLTKWAYDLRLSPNVVTTMALIAGLATAVCLLTGAYLSAAILLQLHHLLDGADGNLARLTQRCTPGGARYDQLSDRIVRVAVFSSVAWAADVSWTWRVGFLGILILDHLVVQYYIVPFMARVDLERSRWKSWFLDRGIIPGFDHFTLFFLISVTFALTAESTSYWILGMSVMGATTFLQYSRLHELLHAAAFTSECSDAVDTRRAPGVRRFVDQIEQVRRKYRLGFMNVGNFYFLNFVFLVAGRADLFLWSLLAVALAATAFQIARSAIKQAETEAGLQQVAVEGKQAVLFGAGEGAAQFVGGFRNRSVEIAYICDNNRDRWGSSFFGVSIVDPQLRSRIGYRTILIR